MKKTKITSAESFWYVLMNLSLGAAYLAKVPVKKALVDFGLVPELTGAERFWYVVENIAFGSGYLRKVAVAKAISELPQYQSARIQQIITL